MVKSLILGLVTASVAFADFADAADFSDPTWPCIQRKVEELSLGIMWPHPVPDGALSEEARELSGKLALRRVSLEETEALIAEFVSDTPGVTSDELGLIFADVFRRVGTDRRRIIAGIGDYSLKQLALADKIDATRVEMDTLMKAAEPDFDKVDALEEQLDWDERIYRDRAQSLTYVCETPVILEKRVYSIAQSLLFHVD